MAEVRAVIARVYSYETPEVLAKQGIEVAIGPVRFVNGATIQTRVPWAVFTHPEVAQAGLSEPETRRQFRDIKAHRLPPERVDRAQTQGSTDGFLKLVSQADGRLVGATAVSPAAGETINELSIAIDRGLTVSDLASTIHVYPTFTFAVQQLAAEISLEAATSGAKGQVTRALRGLS